MIIWGRSYEGLLGKDVNVRREGGAWRNGHFELLKKSGEKDEKLFFSQRLSKTIPFSQAKWNNLLVMDKLSVLIDEPGGIKDVRVLEVLLVMIGVVQAADDCCSLGNGILADLNLFQ